ncbi:MAG: dinitrogenase iron-molybdenum cofactor biosynthesis protein [Anaerolineae bacterium]|nr:dinitrogenase iron-molybdenum cofactor biosynthesis protein [Anaerolineae bacterium]
MKIAVVSDDGKTISRHFGRAAYYLVFTVDEGEIVMRERRDKAGHQQFVQLVDIHVHHEDERGHGFGAHSDDKHHQMVASITDCAVVIARGMGHGAHQSLTSANIQPILTELADAEAAVQAYIDGTLVDHPERLH